MGHLVGPTQAHTGSYECGIQQDAVAAGPADGDKRLSLEIRPRRQRPAWPSGWSRRQARTNGSSIRGSNDQLGIGRAREG